MSWPTGTIATTALDADTDSPLTARPAIKDTADKVNEIVANGEPYLSANMVISPTASKGALRTGGGQLRAANAVYTSECVTLGQSQHLGALVYPADVVTIPDATNTPVLFNSESYDTNSIHDTVTNKSRLTVPSGWTKIKLTGQLAFPANNVGKRQIEIMKNGVSFTGGGVVESDNNGNVNGVVLNVSSPTLVVTAGDYFELVGFQNSTTTLTINNTRSWFSMERVMA